MNEINNSSIASFINIGERTNVTGSARFKKLILNGDFESAIKHACLCINEGAQIIDLGAQSTRPGSPEVGVEIEIKG